MEISKNFAEIFLYKIFLREFWAIYFMRKMEYIIQVYKLVKLAYLVPKLWEISGIGPNTFSFFFH